MSDHPYATPLWIRDKSIFKLNRVEFGSDRFNERWLQEQLFNYPSLIPFEELEPSFKNSVPVAMEVGVRSGSIDILFVNPEGLLTIVETKLCRNPDSRRQVVSQLIDYAAEVAKLSYLALAESIRRSTDEEGDPLLNGLIRGGHSVDEKRFHDAISRNLRLGRFMLLVVGDGIQEGVESMSDFLQGQPHLGFALRLVEMAVFELEDGPYKTLLIQPRIVARTREVVRATIKFEGADRIEVTTPPPDDGSSSGRSPITEVEFYRKLADDASPEQIDFVQRIIRDAPKHGLAVDWKQTGPLLKYVDPVRETFFTLGGFTTWGWFEHTGRFHERCVNEDIPDSVWKNYFDALVALMPSSTRRRSRSKSGTEWEMVVFTDEQAEPLAALMSRESEFWAALDAAVEGVRNAPVTTDG